ncbi:hypothetical protein NC653_014018 [Populus alba x Populus x berolinensis]|uniref:Uncharacterized protein n=1 Tax=Populus alba x Populus x berolinensis TaxID=444605 RepID=A0AAD6QW32_9ROSI|nr:hypothetical protein NC653_014018 [Populus alba x Populus x berolinensis]
MVLKASLFQGIHGFCFTRSLPLRHCPSDQKQRINTSCQLANALVFVSPGNQVGVGSPEEDLNQHPSIV